MTGGSRVLAYCGAHRCGRPFGPGTSVIRARGLGVDSVVPTPPSWPLCARNLLACLFLLCASVPDGALETRVESLARRVMTPHRPTNWPWALRSSRLTCEIIRSVFRTTVWHRQAETISKVFIESTINQVVSRRFVNKPPVSSNSDQDPEQQIFRRWYALLRVQAKAM
jgi:hypothetical protein